ncbi:MAG: translation elongation factor Ts [Leptolinea sp.]|jgi:elongation factor Ts|nr:translation elongation factor Ts [Leptolinea sp.]
MEISTDMIKQLRQATAAGISDCKKALENANGDYNKAVEFLREKGLATAAKRADRAASDGMIELYSHAQGRIGVMVEVNSETDFVGRSEKFRSFAHELALQIAAAAPEYIREEDIPAEDIETETRIATAKAKEDGKPDAILPKIVEGALSKFKDEKVLLRQKYIRDENITIQQLLNDTIVSLGENVVIRRFARWELGESTAEE